MTDLDYQMNALEQILLESRDRLLNAENQIQEATEIIYEAIDRQIDVLIEQTNYPCKHLFQIGGVLINGDRDMGSFCSYKRFDHLNLKTRERTDLKPDFYEKFV